MECAAPLAAPARHWPRSARSSRRSSATSSGSPPRSEPADPEDVDRMLARVLRDGPRADRGATAGWSRSSSATPSSASSASRPPTRTTPSGRCGPGLGSSRTPSELEAVGGEPLRLRVGINTGEALVRLGVEPRSPVSASSRATRSTPPRASSRSRRRWGSRSVLPTYEATAPRLRLRGARAGEPEGQGRAGARVPGEGGAGPLRHRPHPDPRHARSSAVRSTSRCSRASSTRRSPRARSSSSRSSASRGSARAGSSPSCSPTSTPGPSSRPGGRGGASRTARGSPSGRSGRS